MIISLYFLYSFYLLVLGVVSFFLGLLFNLYSYELLLDYEFFSINSIVFSMSFYFDDIALIFMGSVMIISSMVIFYSEVYMSYDLYNVRFLYVVLLFVFSMMMLIISPNMFSLMLGWDGLGLISYCLVIYFNNYKSYNAGMLTILTNRIGDVAILLTLGFMMDWGSFSFKYMFNGDSFYSLYLGWLVILASFTKSAQVPFSTWLPAAMAAPTPVSALVHSSTLVTAGVYLLIRFNMVFNDLSNSLFMVLSCLTMVISGVGAIFEYDLKKIIALSTLSQLGFMMVILFSGDWMCSFFHLISHAFFKSLLFLCAGLIIHCMGDSQDIRHMGSSIMFLPVTFSCFLISTLSLCGVPYLTGFYSKHAALDSILGSGCNLMMGIILMLSICTTSIYSMRLVYYSVVPGMSSFVVVCCEEDLVMSCSMILLCVMSIIGGSMLHWVLFYNYEVSLIDLGPLVMLSMIVSFVMGTVFKNFSYYNYMVNLPLFKNLLNLMMSTPSFSMYILYYSWINNSKLSNSYFGVWFEYSTLGKLVYLIKSASFIEKRVLLHVFNLSILSMLIVIFMFL
uniref:NADH-ubiquinone oxidoreductase chain 5 n=1 Tax=Brachyrhynchus hsiaoi TaxID=928820 RepID=A0A059P0M1_9HEMI|nr:NADH dehydrogenase subunit 5 [Brachyrhynchus hsiaoi]ADQ64020.1 NADH dehydrogenase subunit 5 [Brachyrhynchus hsiaoi]